MSDSTDLPSLSPDALAEALRSMLRINCCAHPPLGSSSALPRVPACPVCRAKLTLERWERGRAEREGGERGGKP